MLDSQDESFGRFAQHIQLSMKSGHRSGGGLQAWQMWDSFPMAPPSKESAWHGA